jgi:hypothetical protein
MDQKIKPLTAIVIGETFTPLNEMALKLQKATVPHARNAPK